jgi:hypothetical protein
MESEGSLPSLQELSTCTYPEPDQSSPQHSLLSLKGPSLSIHLRLGLHSGLFPEQHVNIKCYVLLYRSLSETLGMFEEVYSMVAMKKKTIISLETEILPGQQQRQGYVKGFLLYSACHPLWTASVV